MAPGCCASDQNGRRALVRKAATAHVLAVEEGEAEPPAEAEQPPWILETQRSGLAGWEPTAPPWGLLPGWLAREADPPAFVAFDARDEAAEPSLASTAAGRPGRSAERLRDLIYPQAGLASYSPYVDETTDVQGWIYGSSAQRLSRPRLGGRAGPRLGDRSRRRWWHAEGAEGAGSASSGSHHHDVDASQQLQDRQRAQSSLWEALGSVLARRRLGGLPLDPVAALRRSWKEARQFEAFCASRPPWRDVQDLGPLCLAALYSRAAYGHVARMGLFDSLIQGARVFSVQRAQFDMAEHVDDASNARAFLDMLGLKAADLIFARWKSAGAFCPTFAVARDHEMKWLVVAVRGTLSVKDVMTDLAASGVPFQEGFAHEGFAKTAERLLTVLRLVLPPEVEAFPGYRVVLCGHSMGGAVAAMAAARLRREDAWAAGCVAYSIGTPAVVSRNVSERLASERAVFTVVNGRDWSPRTSLSSALELIDDLVDLGVLRSAIRGGLSHEAPAPSVQDVEREELPPGVMLQIGPPAARGGPPLLLQASAADYRHCMPVFPDMEAHLPICYARQLLRGLAAALQPGAQQVHGPSSHEAFVWENAETHLGGDEGVSPSVGVGAQGPVETLRRGPSAAEAAAPREPPAAAGGGAAKEGEGLASADACASNAAALAALRRLAMRQRSWHGSCESLPTWEDGGRRLVIACLRACS